MISCGVIESDYFVIPPTYQVLILNFLSLSHCVCLCLYMFMCINIYNKMHACLYLNNIYPIPHHTFSVVLLHIIDSIYIPRTESIWTGWIETTRTTWRGNRSNNSQSKKFEDCGLLWRWWWYWWWFVFCWFIVACVAVASCDFPHRRAAGGREHLWTSSSAA